jgi:hypothetical protein
VPARGRTGINVWVSTPDESGAVATLRDLGYAVAPGSLYRLGSAPGFRISVGALELSDVDKLADGVLAAVGEVAVAPVTV